MATVTEVLTAATDSVTVINDINTNGSDSVYWVLDATQTETNEMIQRNVDHLETILAYNGEPDQADIVGDSSDKSSYTDAITTGKAYIAAN